MDLGRVIVLCDLDTSPIIYSAWKSSDKKILFVSNSVLVFVDEVNQKFSFENSNNEKFIDTIRSFKHFEVAAIKNDCHRDLNSKLYDINFHFGGKILGFTLICPLFKDELKDESISFVQCSVPGVRTFVGAGMVGSLGSCLQYAIGTIDRKVYKVSVYYK
nr:p18 protein [Thesium chinense closterovirus 1]